MDLGLPAVSAHFHHHAFAKEEANAEVNGDRLSGVAGLTEFDLHTVTPSIENFSNCSTPLITGFPMRTQDLAAAASARKGLGINRQIPAAFGDIRGGFGSDTDHVRLLIAFMGCTHPDHLELIAPFAESRSQLFGK